MIQLENQIVYGQRFLRKDIGVAIVVLGALGLGWLLQFQVTHRTSTFQSTDAPIRLTYPETWGNADTLQNVLLKVEDPQTNSAYKTNLTVESRDLDPLNPPTLQELTDRRVAQRGALTGYHFLSSDPAVVNDAKAMRLEYAYVVQPIDQPRRASLPAVVHAIEYLIIGKQNAYFVTLAAPENEFADASAQFNQIIQSVRAQ